MFVIIRTDQGGGYVGSEKASHSFTHDLSKAKRYATREQAAKDCCHGNERVVAVSDIMSDR